MRSRSPIRGSSRRSRRSWPVPTRKRLLKTDKIYLVGFMGAGKTTVARALARRLGWRAVDIDELIEQREHATVADLFATQGEPYFRAVERSVLVDQIAVRALSSSRPAAARSSIRRTARSSTATATSVWLDVPLRQLIQRVPADGRRPLAADRAEFERLYAARRAAYEQAHRRVDAGRPSVAAIVEELVDWLEA